MLYVKKNLTLDRIAKSETLDPISEKRLCKKI